MVDYRKFSSLTLVEMFYIVHDVKTNMKLKTSIENAQFTYWKIKRIVYLKKFENNYIISVLDNCFDDYCPDLLFVIALSRPLIKTTGF